MPTEFKKGRWKSTPPPDFTNQLDLFADIGSDASVEGAPERVITKEPEAANGQEPIRADDSASLARTPATDGRGTAPEQPIGPGSLRDTGADRGSAVRTDVGAEDGIPGGLGDSDAGMGIPADRGPPAAIIVRDQEPEAEKRPSRDFRITGAHRIGQGSLREKANDNLTAIRTLKQVESENREATESENAQLARYAGWGAMANAFRPYPPQEWEHTARELRELLSEDEYASARASTPNVRGEPDGEDFRREL